MQALKKQRDSATKKPKPKSAGPAKDPQSIAAKVCFNISRLTRFQYKITNLALKLSKMILIPQNRRERISERLKMLQDLVPNGSKVDFNFSCIFPWPLQTRMTMSFL
jgi:hypothetical protein